MKRPLLIALLSTLLTVAYAALVMGPQSPGGSETAGKLPDTRFTGYTGNDLTAYFKTLSPDQVEVYSQMLAIWDNLFPLVYGAMNMAWLAFIFKGISIRKFRGLIVLLPLLAMSMDYCENYFIREQLLLFQAGGPMLDAGTASMFTKLKWAVAAPLNALIGVGILTVVAKASRRRRKQSS